MPPRIHSILSSIGALALIAGIFFLFSLSHEIVANVSTLEQVELPIHIIDAQDVVASTSSDTPPLPVETVVPTKPQKATDEATKQTGPEIVANKPAANEIARIENPYPFPPQQDTALNDMARLALVNILCTQTGNGESKSISGSGVIIDPRGVILTNAHIAQYVLLSQDTRINISCAIRTGAPASSRWGAEILFMPPVWIEEHADEIAMSRPMGTGEHDYALLLITRSLNTIPLPPSFPFLHFDTREAIGFQDDKILVASYPTEFVGNAVIQSSLYPVTSLATIQKLLTFASTTADLLSLGGIVGAQGGSSGGAVLNMWGFLVGLISTSSEGETTATRDLRAISLSYIERDMIVQAGFGLSKILEGDVVAMALDFNTRFAPPLVQLYIK